MKRWTGLLGLLLLAAIGAVVIATRLQPSDLERRHATIRVGMTPDAVVKIMDTGGPEPLTYLADSGSGYTWSWLPPRRFVARDLHLEVVFDGNARVIRTTANGEQRQP
jgi:hypothetical protein